MDGVAARRHQTGGPAARRRGKIRPGRFSVETAEETAEELPEETAEKFAVEFTEGNLMERVWTRLGAKIPPARWSRAGSRCYLRAEATSFWILPVSFFWALASIRTLALPL